MDRGICYMATIFYVILTSLNFLRKEERYEEENEENIRFRSGAEILNANIFTLS